MILNWKCGCYLWVEQVDYLWDNPSWGKISFLFITSLASKVSKAEYD